MERVLNQPSPNHALQRTAPGVTACAPTRRPAPAVFPHRLRRPPQSLSLGTFGDFPMRLLLLTILGLLTCAAAHAELYLQDESRSPDGTVVFALNYPPTENQTKGSVQGCFVHPKSKKRIGDFFFLPGTTAETHRPGSYAFDNYNVFDYVWSADSTHLAIVHNMRHFGAIHPFRRSGLSFQPLQMPDLVAPLQERLTGVIQESIHTSIKANRWGRKHSLTATIAKDAQLTKTGNDNKDWREHSLQFTISFDSEGKPIIEATKFRVQIPP